MLALCLQWAGVLTISNKYFGNGFVPFQALIPFITFSFVIAMVIVLQVTLSSKVDIKSLALSAVSLVLLVLSIIGLVNINSMGQSQLWTSMIYAIPGIIVLVIGLITGRQKLSYTKKTSILGITILVLGSILGIVMGVRSSALGMEEGFTLIASSQIESWRMIPQTISQNMKTLLLGNGPFLEQSIVNKYISANYLRSVQQGISAGSLSSFIQSILVSYGILGFIGVVIVSVISVRFAWKALSNLQEIRKSSEVNSLILLLIGLNVSIFIVTWSLGYAILFALVASLAVSYYFSLVPAKKKLLEIDWKFNLVSQDTSKANRAASYVLLGLLLVAQLVPVYVRSRDLLSEYYYQKAINSYDDEKGFNLAYLEKAFRTRDDYRYRVFYTAHLYRETYKVLAQENSEIPEENKRQLISLLMQNANILPVMNQYDYRSWLYKGDVYSLLNNVSENYYAQTVLNSYTEAYRLYPLNVNLRFKIADFLVTQGQFDRALRMYEEIVAQFPNYYLSAVSKSAETYYLMGENDKAELLMSDLRDRIDSAMDNGDMSAEVASNIKEQLDLIEERSKSDEETVTDNVSDEIGVDDSEFNEEEYNLDQQ
jgi:tetratricopeptide (TPR) repeat protein